VIAPVPVLIAADALLLDVGDLAIRGDLTVVTRDAAACELVEAEETNEAHHRVSVLASEPEQLLYRDASHAIALQHAGVGSLDAARSGRFPPNQVTIAAR
jgi:hypothetical protein